MGTKCRSAQPQDGTCTLSSSKDRAPSRDEADPTKDDF